MVTEGMTYRVFRADDDDVAVDTLQIGKRLKLEVKTD